MKQKTARIGKVKKKKSDAFQIPLLLNGLDEVSNVVMEWNYSHESNVH